MLKIRIEFFDKNGIKMEQIKYYTDASYCPITKNGIICFDVYNNELMDSFTHKYKNIKNSELEKIGIDLCIEHSTNNNFERIIIFTDCLSAFGKSYPQFVKLNFIKGHNKKSLLDEDGLKFRNVDLRARKVLRLSRIENTQI